MSLRKTISDTPRPIIILVSFAFIGVILLAASQAATPNLALETEAGNRSGGSLKTSNEASGGSYVEFGTNTISPQARRFFADSVSWNKTAAELGISSSFSGYATRMFNYGGASGWETPSLSIGYNPERRGNYNITMRNYSVPIYDASEKTHDVHLYWASWGFPYDNWYVCDGPGIAPCTGNQTKVNMPAGTKMPWNNNWIPGTGTDRLMSVVDYETGETWDYYGTKTEPSQCTLFNDTTGSGNWVLNVQATPAFDPTSPNHFCMAGVTRVPNIYAVNQSNTINGRGMGINKLALVTRAEEVESGEIRHALELTIYNQMFGPACSPDSPSTPGAGISCAFHLAPATRVEHLQTPHSNGCGSNGIPALDIYRQRTVPSGMRFRVNRSPTSIDQWLDQKGYTGVRRDTARTIARALVDYGFIAAAETGCGDPHFEFDGMQNPKTKAKWQALGLVDSGFDSDGLPNHAPDGLPDYPEYDFMHGFITSTNLEVVNPG